MASLRFRVGELFCGPGGLAIGARQATDFLSLDHDVSLEHVWANDTDPDTCRTYLRNVLKPEFGDKARLVTAAHCDDSCSGVVINQDVRELDISALQPVDGFAFGFPCNDYSTIGESRGLEGAYGPLYTYGIEVLARHKPKWFVAENVAGLKSANEGSALRMILAALREPSNGVKYKLVPHLYSFDEYGVPQRRRRIVIVGIRDDLGVDFEVPSPELYTDLDISAAGALSGLRRGVPNHELPNLTARVVERLTHIRPGQNAFNAELPEHLRLNVRGLTNSQVYRRLEPDKPAYTVTGAGGGGTLMYHWAEPRALTNRERARLQTFPDSFVFEGGRESVRKQVGMAVPVSGAEAIFVALFRSFLGIPYPSVDSNMGELVEQLV